MKNLKQVRGEDLFLDARHDKLKFKEKVCSTGNETSLCKKTKKKRISSSHNTTRKQKHNKEKHNQKTYIHTPKQTNLN